MKPIAEAAYAAQSSTAPRVQGSFSPVRGNDFPCTRRRPPRTRGLTSPHGILAVSW